MLCFEIINSNLFNAKTKLDFDYGCQYTGNVKDKVAHSYVCTSDNGELRTYKVGEILEKRTITVYNLLAISEIMKIWMTLLVEKSYYDIHLLCGGLSQYQ